MSFKDQFIQAYRVTRRAAKSNDRNATIEGLMHLRELFEKQMQKNNGDTIRIKATLCHWCDEFAKYAQIVSTNGLSDRRVQKFFGLLREGSPSVTNGNLNGRKEVSTVPSNESEDPYGEIDISGLISPSYEESETSDTDSAFKYSESPSDDSMSVTDIPAMEAPIAEVPVAEDSITEAPATEVPLVEAQTEEVSVVEADDGATIEETIAAPAYNPETLAGFIGQQHIVRILRKEIAIAKNEGRKHLDNILLFGNPGLGKTTLMELIAKELGVRYEWMDCSQYRNSQQSLKALQNFLMNVAQDNEPVVIAFDEIHRLTDELQSSLLTLLQSRVYVSPPDVNGNVKRIPIQEFTFIAATTDDDKVLGTIKDRCLRLKFQMVDYTPDELKQIYRNKVFAKELTITEEAIETCIPRSRGSIRYVNSFVEGLDRALYNDDGVRLSTHIDLQTALRFFEERGIDPIGLESKDLEILRTIGDDSNGTIGADTLSARVGLDTRKYLSEYEPYLLRIGFVAITGKGRGLTEKAVSYLTENYT